MFTLYLCTYFSFFFFRLLFVEDAKYTLPFDFSLYFFLSIFLPSAPVEVKGSVYCFSHRHHCRLESSPDSQSHCRICSTILTVRLFVVSCGAMVRGDLGKSCKSRWRLLGDQTLVNTWGKSVFICVKSHRAVKGRGKKYEYQLIIIGQSYSMFRYAFFGICFYNFWGEQSSQETVLQYLIP